MSNKNNNDEQIYLRSNKAESEESNALIPTQPHEQHALSKYGKLPEVKEVTRRVLLLDTKSEHPLTVAEAIIVAQEAIGTEANVTNGELYWWIQLSGDERQLTIHWGQKYWVRILNEWGMEHGTRFKLNHEQIEDPDEKVKMGFEPDDLVIKCELRDTQLVNEYIEQIDKLAGVKMPLDRIERIVGAEPVIIGYGAVSKRDQEGRFRRSKTIYPHVQRATKRATMNAVKQVVHHKRRALPSAGGADLDGYIKTDWAPRLGDQAIDAVFTDVSDDEISTTVSDHVPEGFEDIAADVAQQRLRDAKERLKFTKDEDILRGRKKPTYWDEDLLKALVKAGVVKNEVSAAQRLAYSPYEKDTTATSFHGKQAIEWLKAFDEIKQSGEPHDNHSAALEATVKVYLEPVESNKK